MASASSWGTQADWMYLHIFNSNNSIRSSSSNLNRSTYVYTNAVTSFEYNKNTTIYIAAAASTEITPYYEYSVLIIPDAPADNVE